LRPGMVFAGPAIIEDPGTTVVIHPGNRVTVDGFLNIIIATSV
jgi:N-methylhydantoinase A